MKKILLGVVAGGLSLLYALGILAPPAKAADAVLDDAALKEALARRDGQLTVRSRHAAVDRLIATERLADDAAGHDKTSFDREYDKQYDRSTYTKTYEKTS